MRTYRRADMSVRTRMRGPVLCEQALAADPSNVRAPTWLAVKTYYSATARGSAGPGLKRADELVLTEQHCHRFVDMSRRNVSVCGRRRITTGSRAAGTVVSFKKRGV